MHNPVERGRIRRLQIRFDFAVLPTGRLPGPAFRTRSSSGNSVVWLSALVLLSIQSAVPTVTSVPKSFFARSLIGRSLRTIAGDYARRGVPHLFRDPHSMLLRLLFNASPLRVGEAD